MKDYEKNPDQTLVLQKLKNIILRYDEYKMSIDSKL